MQRRVVIAEASHVWIVMYYANGQRAVCLTSTQHLHMRGGRTVVLPTAAGSLAELEVSEGHVYFERFHEQAA